MLVASLTCVQRPCDQHACPTCGPCMYRYSKHSDNRAKANRAATPCTTCTWAGNAHGNAQRSWQRTWATHNAQQAHGQHTTNTTQLLLLLPFLVVVEVVVVVVVVLLLLLLLFSLSTGSPGITASRCAGLTLTLYPPRVGLSSTCSAPGPGLPPPPAAAAATWGSTRPPRRLASQPAQSQTGSARQLREC